MITEKDIAQALKRHSQRPSKDWQNSTLRRLREVSKENYVTESVEVRNSLRHKFVSLASYFFPTSTMNPVIFKTIGSLAAAGIISVGAHAFANSATPENTFLYSVDRGFETVEIAFAALGGDTSVAYRHLSHAEERITEMEVLLRGESSASVSFTSLFVETAHAQNIGASAQLSAYIELLVRDSQVSLHKAFAILEKVSERTSAKARSKLAASIEATSQNISERLEANAALAVQVDARPIVRTAVIKVRETQKKAQSISVKAQAEIQSSGEVNVQRKKADKDANSDENTDSPILDVDVPIVEVHSSGMININNNATVSGEVEPSATGSVNGTVHIETQGTVDTDLLDADIQSETGVDAVINPL